ncbi:MAG: hypothetical protein JSR18_10150 [Proteobacteria bacterium]|nr:hypothetical protein [Pseudomonadota bacterium]
MAVLAALFIGATRVKPQGDWLALRIQELERAAPANPPRSIVATRYRGQRVYFVARRCCDFPSALYAADGRLLCHPDGGFIGRDERCADFQLPGPDAEVVWVDPRAVP